MKKLCLILTLIMILSFICACNGADKDTAKDNSDTSKISYGETKPTTNEVLRAYSDFVSGKVTAKDDLGKYKKDIKVTDLKNENLQPGIDSYAFYDMNNDGVTELLTDSYTFQIFTYKDGKIHLLFEDSKMDNYDILSGPALLSSKETTGTTYNYTRMDNNANIKTVSFFDGGDKGLFYYDEKQVSSSEYKELTDAIFENKKSNSVVFEWYLYDSSPFTEFLKEKSQNGSIDYFITDFYGDGTKELILVENTTLSIYTYNNEKVSLIGKNDFVTGTFRLFPSDNEKRGGVFYFYASGGQNHYGYLETKENKLELNELLIEDYSGVGGTSGKVTEISNDKDLISECKKAYENGCDIKLYTYNSALDLI